MSKTKKKAQKTRPKLYPKGSINRLVDDLVHPLYKQNASLIFLDGFFHSLVEQNLPLSVRKFIRYNLPKLLKRLNTGYNEESMACGALADSGCEVECAEFRRKLNGKF